MPFIDIMPFIEISKLLSKLYSCSPHIMYCNNAKNNADNFYEVNIVQKYLIADIVMSSENCQRAHTFHAA